MNEMVYIIMNEWTADGEVFEEITDGKFFVSEQDAWDALNAIAEAHGVELPMEDRLVSVPLGSSSQDYYIMNLTRG